MAGYPFDSPRIVAIAATVGLALGVGALSVFALQRGSGTGAGPETGSAPSLSFHTEAAPAPSATVVATPSPTPTPTPTAAFADPSLERLLAVSGDQVWRATAGACARPGVSAVAPVVEYSTDGGQSWRDVTPADARQVLNLAVFGVGESEVIAATGADCAPADLRTFSSGRTWWSYPDALKIATYVSPTDTSSVVVASSTTEAPCADARSARTSRDATGVLCGDTAWSLSDGRWSQLTTGAVALDALSGTILVAHVAPTCPGGVALTRFSGTTGTAVGCVANVDATTPAAVSMLGRVVLLWSGDAVHAPG